MNEEKPNINLFTNIIQFSKILVDNNLNNLSINFLKNSNKADVSKCSSLTLKMLGIIPLEFLAKPVQNSFNRQKIEIKGLCPDITVEITLPKEMVGQHHIP